MSLNNNPTRSEREQYDSHAPDWLWCQECGKREDECTCGEEDSVTDEEGKRDSADFLYHQMKEEGR